MKKFTSYSLQVTGFLITAIVILFVAPATASAAPTATVSGDSWTWVNQTAWYRTTLYNAGSGQIYITREDGNSFTCPAGLSGRWCLIGTRTNASSGTSFWASFTPREFGAYRIVVNAYSNSNNSFTGDRNTECTGNPFGYNTNQWSDCGSSDNMSATFYVQAPTPSVTVNSSCTSTDTSNLVTLNWSNTSPQVTYADISSNSFSGWNYKYVAGSTSTTAANGFSSAYNVSGPLTFNPGTWYATRLWNGSAHSNSAWFYIPAACPPPRATLNLTSGSQNIIVGNTNGFRADLTNAGSGQIWVTKGDGRSNFSCPSGIYAASTGFYWCPIIRGSGSTLSGSYNFAEPGTYTVVVNAFTKSDQTGTGPTNQCTGTPSSLGLDPNKWSDCGVSSRMTITVKLPTPTCSEAHPGADTTIATSGSFRVYATGVQNASTINFPTWSEVNGQDDIIWYPGTNAGGGTWYADIDLARHPGTGWIRVHTYMHNASYTNEWCDSADFQRVVPNCNASPDCDLCPAPANTCSANNGTTTCYYRSYTGGGSCNVVSFTQSCTINKCYSGYTCSGGICVPPPPTATINSPATNSSLTIGQGGSISATANGVNLNKVELYRAPANSDLTQGANWIKITEKTCGGSSSCSLTGSWTPSASESNQWVISVNAFDNYNQRCSGVQSSSGYWTAYCGRNGSTSNITVKIVPSSPTNPAATCPIPGTTANLSWNGVSGATRYDVFAFNTAYSEDWSRCGTNSLVECKRATGTSHSFTTTPGVNYKWYVFACNDYGCSTNPASYSSTFTCVPMPPPPTANLNAPANNSSNIINQSMAVSATAAGTNLKKINIYRAPKGTSNWTRIAENDTCGGQSICGVSSSWTPTAAEAGQWDISVNAFDNYGQQCSGMQSSSGYWTAYCGRNDSTSNVMVNVVFPSPTAQITSPVNNSSFITGQNINVTAAAQIISPGSLTRGEIVVTNATDPNNPTLPVNCPGKTSGYWCYIKEAALTGRSALFEGDWIPRAAGVYRIAVNAFDDTNNTKCTGNPFTVAAGWSSCGSYRWTQVNVAPPPPPPTTTINSPANQTPITIGQSMTFSATANGSNLTWMDIYRAPVNTQDWTKIAGGSCSGSTCTLSGPWIPTAGDVKQWKIAVNAFDSYDQRCSGMEITQPSHWTAYCGRNGSTSNITVNVILPPPQATISGSKTATVTDTPSYTATLSETAQSGQIWITKGNGLDRFSCNTQMIQASNTQRYWCLVGQGTEQSITGGYQFNEAGEYTVVVNAFNQTNPEGTSQADRCTGTPDALAGGNVTWDTWSRCDPPNNNQAYITVTANPPLTTTNCGGGINPRAEGLVTTPSLTGQFGTSTEGKCVVDTKTTFTPFKIPSYDELKSLYYTQSKVKVAPKADSTLVPESEDGKVFSYTAPNVTIDSLYRYNKTAVIFIEGNLNIDENIITDPATPAKGVVFVVQKDKNVNIDQSVNRIDAIIISAGNIYTATTAGAVCATNSVNVGASVNALTVNGSLVSLNPGKIVFCRKLDRNDCASCAAEKINNQPKYLVILSNLFASTLQKWSDITAGGSVVPTNCKTFNGNASACYNKGCSYNYLSAECQ